jgi:hypothetical protein
MSGVRDEAIDHIERIIDGRMKGRDAVDIRLLLQKQQQCESLLKVLLPYVVDVTLHTCLSLFEQEDHLRLMARAADGDLVDVAEISDGLAGELYSEDGWIAKYSRYPQSLLGT